MKLCVTTEQDSSTRSEGGAHLFDVQQRSLSARQDGRLNFRNVNQSNIK